MFNFSLGHRHTTFDIENGSALPFPSIRETVREDWCVAAHRLRSPFDAARVAPEKLIRISPPRHPSFADDTLRKVTGNATQKNTDGRRLNWRA
jgi:hypothetical protein